MREQLLAQLLNAIERGALDQAVVIIQEILKLDAAQ